MTKRILIAALLTFAMTGCSTFRMGSVCFLEYGAEGYCIIKKNAPVELRPE